MNFRDISVIGTVRCAIRKVAGADMAKWFRWIALAVLCGCASSWPGLESSSIRPPPEWRDRFGPYKSLLRFDDGSMVRHAQDWPRRRREISDFWRTALGPLPEAPPASELVVLEEKERDGIRQERVEIPVTEGVKLNGYLLVPRGRGPFPAMVVVYYEPETSIGLGNQPLRDFGWQLAQRGFVTLSVGSPGNDARRPPMQKLECQPLYFLAWSAEICRRTLEKMPAVDGRRMGIVGHSYGGKWAMFAACLFDGFSCGAWSDPGIVFDEARPNVNYWEPWYLGLDRNASRKPGSITADNPRTGLYKKLRDEGHDLHELLALMAPRPFLVSGGSEDTSERWEALNRVNEVYALLGGKGRVALTLRSGHTPTVESNEQLYQFFERTLKRPSL